jgi:predicted PurR-regulated permease PerM
VFALAAAAVIVWLASPLAIGIFLGTLLAFTTDSFYQWLLKRAWRPWLAALVGVGVATLALVGTAAATFYLLVSRGVVLASALLASLGPDGGARAFILRTSARFPREFQVETLIEKLRGAAAGLAERAGVIAGALIVLTTWPTLPLDDEVLALVSVGIPIGLGVYWASARPTDPERSRIVRFVCESHALDV